jgi:hypothetical protein
MPATVVPRTTRFASVGVGIAIVVVAILWIVPGFLAGPSSCPFHANENGRSFCAERVAVTERNCTGNQLCTMPPAVGFQGVQFRLSLENSSSGPVLSGLINESNGVGHNLELVGDPLGPPALNWTSPDDTVLVAWNTPFVSAEVGGPLFANVTCGVYLAS